jgi:hypothetical protein
MYPTGPIATPSTQEASTGSQSGGNGGSSTTASSGGGNSSKPSPVIAPWNPADDGHEPQPPSFSDVLNAMVNYVNNERNRIEHPPTPRTTPLQPYPDDDDRRASANRGNISTSNDSPSASTEKTTIQKNAVQKTTPVAVDTHPLKAINGTHTSNASKAPSAPARATPAFSAGTTKPLLTAAAQKLPQPTPIAPLPVSVSSSSTIRTR